MLLFLVDLINIEIFRISFNFFYSFYFILRSRATSECRCHARMVHCNELKEMKEANEMKNRVEMKNEAGADVACYMKPIIF